jgi:hypothetical protein
MLAKAPPDGFWGFDPEGLAAELYKAPMADFEMGF